MTRRCPVDAMLRQWAQQRPGRTCVAVDGEAITYAEMDQRADRVAAGFAALGVRPGDRVATLAPNRIELLELLFGLARAGAIQVPLNAYLKGAFLRHQLRDCSAQVVITDASGRAALDALRSELPELDTVVMLDDDYASVVAAGPPVPDVVRGPDDAMSILYTSGTTGLPKGCVLSRGYYRRTGRLLGEALECGDGDVMYSALPLFHAGGQLMMLMSALYYGIPACIDSSFSATAFLARAGEVGATLAMGVGAMGAALLATPAGPFDRAHSVRTMLVAPMTPSDQDRFRARFGIEPFTELYGQTECIPAALGGPAAAARDPAGCGLPASDLELALLDDDECPVATGAVGEACIRAPRAAHALFDGYWGMPPRPDGAWHHTGDAARLLASGALAFVDRKKDSLRRRGENVSSLELEAAIARHPDIEHCAVHAVPSALAEDDIKVCVVLRDGASLPPEPFFAFLQQQVPYFAVPRYVEIVDQLPRNAVGRVMKHVLRERPLTADVWDFDALGLVVSRSARR